MYGYVYIKLYVFMFAGGERVLNNVYNEEFIMTHLIYVLHIITML